MPIAPVGTPTAVSDSSPSSTITGTAPTGVGSTDVMFATILWDGSTAPGNPTPPTGWTLMVSSVPALNLQAAVYWALGSVSAFTWTLNSGIAAYADLAIAAYSGVDNTNPFSSVASASHNATLPSTTTAIAVPTGNWFACSFCPYETSSFTWSTPTGLTARLASGASIGIFDSNGADPGSISASSTPTPTPGTSENVALAWAINPAAGTLAQTVAAQTQTQARLGLLVNMPVQSVTSTSAAIGTFLIPNQPISATTQTNAQIGAMLIEQVTPPTDLWSEEYRNNPTSYSAYSDVFREVNQETPTPPDEDSWVVRLRQFGKRFF